MKPSILRMLQSFVAFQAIKSSFSIQKNNNDKLQMLRSQTNTCTLCLLAILPEPENLGRSDFEDTEYRCQTQDASYHVDYIPKEILQNFVSCRTKVEFTQSGKQDDSVVITKIVHIELGRKPLEEGDLSVAIIRVTGADGYAPTKSAAQLADDVLGVSGDPFNLKVGFEACSGNKVRFYAGTGNNLVNGAMDITLDENVGNVASGTVENYAKAKLTSLGFPWNDGTYDYYLIMLPDEVNFGGAAAYAWINGDRSVYMNGYGSLAGVLIHEIGHNFGVYHSGEGTAGYADHTCFMGNPSYSDDKHRMCFNGAKSWYFGWYSDRHLEIDFGSDESGVRSYLLSINDYLNGLSNSASQNTVVKLNAVGNERDAYILYNRAKGINVETDEYPDEVTIVEVESKQARYQSWLMGHLSVGESYRKDNWGGTGHTLVIEFCEMVTSEPEYANIILYLDGSGNEKSCVDTVCGDGVCQYPYEMSTTCPQDCAVVPIDDSGFFVAQMELDWDDHLNNAQGLGMTLSSIMSNMENNVIKNHLLTSGNSKDVWTGGKKKFQNYALSGTASQSSTAWGGYAEYAIDGNTDSTYGGGSITHTLSGGAWWSVDFSETIKISQIKIWNRLDCCSDRLTSCEVQILDTNGNIMSTNTIPSSTNIRTFTFDYALVEGASVKLVLSTGEALSLAEVEVFGYRFGSPWEWIDGSPFSYNDWYDDEGAGNHIEMSQAVGYQWNSKDGSELKFGLYSFPRSPSQAPSYNSRATATPSDMLTLLPTASPTNIPSTFTDMPSTFTDMPSTFTDMPSTFTDTPSTFTDMPSAFPTSIPPFQWTLLSIDDFESSWGNFTKGRKKAKDVGRWKKGGNKKAYGGSLGSLWIRSGNTTKQAFVSKNSINVSSLDKIKVTFWFVAHKFEENEKFSVEYKADGEEWKNIATYIYKPGTANTEYGFKSLRKWYFKSVEIGTSSANLLKLKFRCQANEKNDRVFIDDIMVEGWGASQSPLVSILKKEEAEEVITNKFDDLLEAPTEIPLKTPSEDIILDEFQFSTIIIEFVGNFWTFFFNLC